MVMSREESNDGPEQRGGGHRDWPPRVVVGVGVLGGRNTTRQVLVRGT